MDYPKLGVSILVFLDLFATGFRALWKGTDSNVSILVFVDLFATNLFFKRKALPKELYFCSAISETSNLFFWIKPFSKRFDVSILVFLDSPTTGRRGQAILAMSWISILVFLDFFATVLEAASMLAHVCIFQSLFS